MYASKFFTACTTLTFLLLVAVLVLQALEMKAYEMF